MKRNETKLEQQQSDPVISTVDNDRFRRTNVSFAAPFVGKVSLGSSWERRLQTLALYTCSLYFFMPVVPFCWFWMAILLAFPFTTIPAACYLGYIFLIDNSPISGEREPYMRNFKRWWSHACDYFPILLVKTAELSPNQNYVMGYHPHGIISVGALGAFATEGAKTLSLVGATNRKHLRNDNDDEDDSDEEYDGSARGFSSLFPGIDQRLITLPVNFQTPFLREYILSMGCCNSTKETFRTVLSRKKAGTGNAVVVVVGGAEESMCVTPGSIDLVLEKRRGFVREAILANACLVPVIAFGETDLYHVIDTDSHQWIVKLQLWIKQCTGVAMPLFRGRSFFFQEFGVLPMRKPIVVVVGSPIRPPDISASNRAMFHPDIDRKTDKALNKDGQVLIDCHAQYVKALKALYQEHKDSLWNNAGRNRKRSMVIVK